MDPFLKFKEDVSKQFAKMCEGDTLFQTDVDKDGLWLLYLDTLDPPGSPLYRVRSYHDCSVCRNFVKRAGNVVSINDDLSMSTIWDVAAFTEGPYQQAADRLRTRK